MNANPHASESVGTLGEEAAKLVHALTAAAEQRPSTGETRTHETPDCAFCPICQVIGVVRETSPETVEHLGASLSALTSAVRSVLHAHTGERTPRRDDGAHRIDLDDDEAWGDDGWD